MNPFRALPQRLCALAAPLALFACETEPEIVQPKPIIADGKYYMGMQVVPFGIKLFFEADLVTEASAGGGGKIRSLALTAVSKEGVVVPGVIASAKEVVVAKDGSFKVDFGSLVLPAKGSPTSTDVPIELNLTGILKADSAFCGLVDGYVPSFKVALTGSKFKAVTWGKHTTSGETSCEGDPKKVYTGIATCPTLAVGKNAMKSAEIDRSFQVYLPDAGTPADAVPLVFLYHGVDGSGDGVLKETQFATLLKSESFVLVVPESARVNGTKLKTDWYYGSSLFGMDNPDLVFFDDMVKCASDQYKIDPKRIYVTGMSGGGLMTTFAAMHRGAKVAAAAPFSGGYLHAFAAPAHKLPMLITWGGKTDKAFEQDFDILAKELIGNFSKHGHFVVQCEHTTGHKWPLAMNAAAWAFLSVQRLGEPIVQFASGLPSAFPPYCKIVATTGK